jgi:DNA-3-methyladenine glycosylase
LDRLEARLDLAFYERDTVLIAMELLGTTLVVSGVSGISSGRIVEVEAYRDATDLASHAARLKQGGVESMRRRPGIAYVYRAYGIHTMFNVVAKAPDAVGAVLVRAIEPIDGLELMIERRGSVAPQSIGSGPGNLCKALGIELADHGQDLVNGDRIWLEHGQRPERILAGERIGITKAVQYPWRFFDPDSRSVSAHRRGQLVS